MKRGSLLLRAAAEGYALDYGPGSDPKVCAPRTVYGCTMPVLPRLEPLAAGVRAGERTALGRAITLVESTDPEHRELAGRLLAELAPGTGGAVRVGVSGVPGVGKSTFLDTLGMLLVERGHRVAVLAVDPSSERSGGSILGDKTRMQRLAQEPAAFIRPSPTGGSVGGVASRTRESMIVCEAAGYDVVLVETVGTGQSETAVAHLVDTFLLLLLAGAGDELQGIKRGVLELADVFAVNKADGDNRERCERAAAELRSALRILRPDGDGWSPPVLAVSARSGAGVAEVWQAIGDHRRHLKESGELERRRAAQQRRWVWAQVEEHLLARVRRDPGLRNVLPELERQLSAGEITTEETVTRILRQIGTDPTAGTDAP